MNHVDRILKHAKRAKTKLLVVCAGSLGLSAALIIGSPKTGTSESPLLPNNLPLQNPSGLHATFSTSGSIDLRNEVFHNRAPHVEPATGARRPGPSRLLEDKND